MSLSVGIGLTLYDRSGTHSLLDLAALAFLCGAVLLLTRARSRDEGELASLRGLTELLQDIVVPDPPTELGPLKVAWRYEAADSEARIGGDAYGVEDTRFGVRLLVADVRGKGLGAIEAVTILLGAFREAAHHVEPLADVVERVEQSLTRSNNRRDNSDESEWFTTALFAEISGNGDTVRLINRGHPPPVLFGLDGRARHLGPSEPDLPLTLALTLPGAAEGLFDAAPTIDTFALPEGASLLLLTDGVTEARNVRGVFYDPAIGLAGRLFTDPDTLLDTLLGSVAGWTGHSLHDDMALLAVTRTAPPTPGDR
nr:PP2C family protein-serine/threonine phosphatase [Streptomyces sp. SID3343]